MNAHPSTHSHAHTMYIRSHQHALFLRFSPALTEISESPLVGPAGAVAADAESAHMQSAPAPVAKSRRCLDGDGGKSVLWEEQVKVTLPLFTCPIAHKSTPAVLSSAVRMLLLALYLA